jgi:hypothetical protein
MSLRLWQHSNLSEIDEQTHIIFFGTHPTLTQVPPHLAVSTTATLAPCLAARLAVAIPPDPPPITRRSNIVPALALICMDVLQDDVFKSQTFFQILVEKSLKRYNWQLISFIYSCPLKPTHRLK